MGPLRPIDSELSATPRAIYSVGVAGSAELMTFQSTPNTAEWKAGITQRIPSASLVLKSSSQAAKPPRPAVLVCPINRRKTAISTGTVLAEAPGDCRIDMLRHPSALQQEVDAVLQKQFSPSSVNQDHLTSIAPPSIRSAAVTSQDPIPTLTTAAGPAIDDTFNSFDTTSRLKGLHKKLDIQVDVERQLDLSRVLESGGRLGSCKRSRSRSDMSASV